MTTRKHVRIGIEVETTTKAAPSIVTLKDVDLNSVDALGRRKIEMLDFFAKGVVLSYYPGPSGLGI